MHTLLHMCACGSSNILVNSQLSIASAKENLFLQFIYSIGYHIFVCITWLVQNYFSPSIPILLKSSSQSWQNQHGSFEQLTWCSRTLVLSPPRDRVNVFLIGKCEPPPPPTPPRLMPKLILCVIYFYSAITRNKTSIPIQKYQFSVLEVFIEIGLIWCLKNMILVFDSITSSTNHIAI